MSRTRNDVTFLAIGRGARLAECQEAAKDLDCVHFLGERRDVGNVIRAFDVGVLCSFGEGLPNSVMEYMAFGKPVIATDRGGTRELVIHEETGLLVAPQRPDDVASAILHLLDHPDVAARMGMAGQRRLQREFSLRRMVDATIDLYRRAAQKTAIPATA